ESENMKACIELAKKHLKDSQTIRNKILWSDESKNFLALILCGMCGENQALLITCSISIQSQQCFTASGNGRLFAIEEKINVASGTFSECSGPFISH
uniref:Uncharacterized protein n=1 Tax=Astyanax mexicanus TaxID=7994 RepID=A0A8B9GT72_ASTMX